MAADLLMSNLQTGKHDDVRCLLETWLVVRDTTAPAPESSLSRAKKKAHTKSAIGNHGVRRMRSTV